MNPDAKVIRLAAVWGVFVVVAIFWLVLNACIAPVHGQSDTIIHKGGGINWAMGLGFVNATADNHSMEFKPYGSYPPLYSFVFGLWSKAFGVGEYQNTYFELIIGIIRNALFLWLALHFLSDALTQKSALLLGFLFALTSPYHHYQDRPESFCVILLQVGILAFALTKQARWRYFGLGISLGLIAITSPFCAIATTVAYAVLLFADIKTLPSSGRFNALSWLFAGGILPIIPALLYYVAAPTALEALIKHGTTVGGLSRSFARLLLEGDFHGLKRKAYDIFGGGYAYLHYQIGAVLALLISMLALSRIKSDFSLYLRIAFVAIFLLAFSISSSPHYFAYLLWAFALLAIYAVWKSNSNIISDARPFVWALIFLVTLLCVPTIIRHTYARWHYRKEYQQKTASLRRILQENDDVKYIVASPYYYHLLRPFRPTFDYSIMHKEDLDRIKASGAAVLLYEDTTLSRQSRASQSLLYKLFWKPGDERFVKVYRIGEYLFVEAP